MSSGTSTLPPAEWQSRERAYQQRVEPWVRPRLQRQSLHQRHPVDDFLFEYYPTRPAQLLRWHPGMDLAMTGKEAEKFLAWRGYGRLSDGSIGALPALLSPRRLDGVRWIASLLCATRERSPHFGCSGLHEWAMVYQCQEIRHTNWPLRVRQEDIAQLLSQCPPTCTHYDAFRFFTPAARPLNRFQPTRESQPALEQPGCLHANMDLYKWSTKLLPYAPSELVADCFALAREIRELDMRASPYDLSALGLRAVPIETREGRSEYEALQRGFAERATPLRERLIGVCERVIAAAEAASS